MKILTSFSLVIATAFSNLLFAQQQLAPSIIWQKCYGGSKEDRAKNVITTFDNGYLIVGSSTSNDGDVSGHHGSTDTTDAWMVKLSAEGAIQWQKSFGGIQDDEFTKVIVTNDGGYLAIGNTSSNDGDVSGYHGGMDEWVVKLDRQGNILWQRCLGGSGTEIVSSVTNTADNGYIIIGNTTGSNNGDVSGNHGGTDIWVVKLTNSGSISWQRCYGGTQLDDGYDVVALPANYLIATETYSRDGDFVGSAGNEPLGYVLKIDLQGQLIQRSVCGGIRGSYRDIKPKKDGNFLVLENFTSCYPGNPTDGIRIRQFFPDLSCSSLIDFSYCWYPPSGPAQGYLTRGPDNLIPLTDGSGIVSGSTDDTISVLGKHGGLDGFLGKFSVNGNLHWKKCYGGSAEDRFQSLIVQDEFNYLAVGYTKSNNGDVSGNHGGSDFWIVKLGKFNIQKGTVFNDLDNNGQRGANEPLVNGTIVESSKQNQSSASSTQNGYFTNAVDTGTYITRIISTIPYYTSVPLSKTTTFSSYNNTDSVVFALQPIPGQRDYEVALFALTQARPGFDLMYKIRIINRGTDTLLGREIKFKKDSRLTFQNSQPAPLSISGDTIKWSVSFLAPRDTGFITIKLMPPVGVVTISDVLESVATIDTTADLKLINNTSTLRQRVSGSYDPNDKRETHAGSLLESEVAQAKALVYTIRFQNTGTDTAFNVVVRDTLDTKVDFNAVEMVSASHPYQLSIKDGNKLTWTFTNILLADSNRNEPASHGYITYSINPKSNLIVGDTIKNSASIYFDFNLPVKTNTEITIVKLAPPPQPTVTGIQNNYCSNQGVQKGKITNLPSATSGTVATVKLDENNLTIAADSTFSFDVGTMSAGSHNLKIIYTNSTASDSVAKTFTVTAAATPDVNVSANITNVISLANPVVVTAANAAGGGTTPLYTFAKDRTFSTILQSEGNNNILNINPADLQVGDNWIYVRMKTSLSCYTTQTNIDSILLKRDAVTGIIDVDDPGRVINIYPNPFNRQININGLNPMKQYEITIVDLNGKQVLKKQVQNTTQLNLPVRSHSAGIYLLNIFDKQKQRLIGSVRMVKQ